MALFEDVVLRDEVSGNRVDAHAKESCGQVKDQSLDTEKIRKSNIKGNRRCDICKLVQTHGLGIHQERTQRIKGWLQDNPEDLFESRVEGLPLPVGGDVDVDDIDSLRIVVFQVVLLEGDARGQALSAVGNHPQQFVVNRRFEAQVVGQFVVAE